MKHAKIKEYRVMQHGHRGRVVSLPKVWVDDNGLAPGDLIEVYRTDINSEDCLILKIRKATDEITQPTEELQQAV